MRQGVPGEIVAPGGVDFGDCFARIVGGIPGDAPVVFPDRSGEFGPDFVSSNGAGTNTTSIPSAVFVALFAYLGTRVVARHGFTRPRATDT